MKYIRIQKRMRTQKEISRAQRQNVRKKKTKNIANECSNRKKKIFREQDEQEHIVHHVHLFL